ncbi:DUF2252 domain-containing protein [Streptomyces sp. NPDC089799]|uniref:DUF2252 domain-containing protein n=1 Tax=Streptomyces sp. NPDC089799 TaxID=3155066 RepID=UPI0034277FFC
MASPAERAQRGRATRKRVSRRAHGQWSPASDRPDPIGVLVEQGTDRVQELLPIRYGRMSASPFAYLRGSAAVMTGDLASTPHTGLIVQLCGDAHLLNFGVFASPERAMLFDLNDFDETLPGPFEWDVKRLAASVAVAARENGHGDEAARGSALEAVQAYRLSMRRLAGQGELDVWYERIGTDEVFALAQGIARERVEANLSRARRRTSLQALAKLTEKRDGRIRIIDDPPLLQPVTEDEAKIVGTTFRQYRDTLPEERRMLLDRYHFVDAARKVVGVGSVGTRCFIVLMSGRDDADPLFLQIKEAVPSVLEAHLPVPTVQEQEQGGDQGDLGYRHPRYDHHGHRVVAGQRLLQAAGDIFLGWVTGPAGRHFYNRQLRDMKGAAVVEAMAPTGLRRYAALCGTALARAHARSGDRIAIAGYLGASDVFDRSVADFALAYADLTRADHALLAKAIADGTVPATPGV